MTKTTKATRFHINIGSSSILLIFVILCLIAFATLSIVSANADAKLTNKVAERTTSYYEAHNQATTTIAALNNELANIYLQAADENNYFNQTGHEKYFEFPISDLQSLSVRITILYPPSQTGPFYEIRSWKVITTTDIEYENNMIIIP